MGAGGAQHAAQVGSLALDVNVQLILSARHRGVDRESDFVVPERMPGHGGKPIARLPCGREVIRSIIPQ